MHASFIAKVPSRSIRKLYYLFTLFIARELGSGAFGKVFLADALGIVAFDPRGSTKKRSSRRRFGGSVRRNHYVNNNKMTKVAVKTLKGIQLLDFSK